MWTQFFVDGMGVTPQTMQEVEQAIERWGALVVGPNGTPTLNDRSEYEVRLLESDAFVKGMVRGVIRHWALSIAHEVDHD